MSLSAGSKLGPYEIVAPLGAGGMGEVYRARDTKLGREVALKVLPAAFASDADRMARFQREAQVLASLNHPNIASIYGLEESGSTRALVMELVEGPTLAERIVGAGLAPPYAHRTAVVGAGLAPPSDKGTPRGAPTGPIAIDEALQIAKQIAEALEYAHERGIIHRDLKPANVKVTHDGAVKVLDFGLAKALSTEDSGTNISNSPTISIAATQAGMILGTAAYMSPEQAKGKSVDRRADIWAFGCVLFEMLTGRKTFEGETTSDVLAAVIRAEPEWNELPQDTPPSIRKLIQRCLQKDPKQRLQAIGEVRIAIEETLSGSADVVAAMSPSPDGGHRPPLQFWRGKLLVGLAGVIVGALLAGMVAWKWFRRASPLSAMHFSAVTNFPGVQAQPSLAPDGRSVAFASNRDGHYDIYVGLIAGGSLVRVTNSPNLKARPRWSPDGTKVAYAQLNEAGLWDIWQVEALGGTPRRIILNAADPAWSPDGRSLAYAGAGGIWISDAAGRNAHAIAPEVSQGVYDVQPSFSPTGRKLAFIRRTAGPYGELKVVDLDTSVGRELTHDGAFALSPAWSPDGRFIYFSSSRGGTLNIWKIPADGGEPEQITVGQGDDAELDVSADGKRIVFSTYRENINIAEINLESKTGGTGPKWLTRDPARNALAPVYSRDGKHIAYFSNLKGIEKESIWMANADGSNPVQLVVDDRRNIFPHFAPDGQSIIYAFYMSETIAGSHYSFYRVAATGGLPEKMPVDMHDYFFDVGPDGRLLFWGPKGEIQTFDPKNNRTETLQTVSATGFPLRCSPDGRSVAYIIQPRRENDPEAGLWVTDLRHPPRQVFRGWVVWYAWGPNDEILLLQGKPDLNGIIWSVRPDGSGLRQTSTTIPLGYSFWRQVSVFFDVSPDGRHIATDMAQVLEAHIGMIENLH